MAVEHNQVDAVVTTEQGMLVEIPIVEEAAHPVGYPSFSTEEQSTTKGIVLLTIRETSEPQSTNPNTFSPLSSTYTEIVPDTLLFLLFDVPAHQLDFCSVNAVLY